MRQRDSKRKRCVHTIDRIIVTNQLISLKAIKCDAPSLDCGMFWCLNAFTSVCFFFRLIERSTEKEIGSSGMGRQMEIKQLCNWTICVSVFSLRQLKRNVKYAIAVFGNLWSANENSRLKLKCHWFVRGRRKLKDGSELESDSVWCLFFSKCVPTRKLHFQRWLHFRIDQSECHERFGLVGHFSITTHKIVGGDVRRK